MKSIIEVNHNAEVDIRWNIRGGQKTTTVTAICEVMPADRRQLQ